MRQSVASGQASHTHTESCLYLEDGTKPSKKERTVTITITLLAVYTNSQQSYSNTNLQIKIVEEERAVDATKR